MFHNQIRLSLPQLFERVVARQNRTRSNPAMPGGFNVMLHVANEKRFVRIQTVFFQDLVNLLAFIPNIDIGPLQILLEAGDRSLCREMVMVNCAQQEAAQFASTTEFEKIACM